VDEGVDTAVAGEIGFFLGSIGFGGVVTRETGAEAVATGTGMGVEAAVLNA